MTGPCTKRPAVSVIDGYVWAFVGGQYQRLDLAAAKVLRDKLSAAIKQLKREQDV